MESIALRSFHDSHDSPLQKFVFVQEAIQFGLVNAMKALPANCLYVNFRLKANKCQE